MKAGLVARWRWPLLLAGCGSKPRAPDWQMNAHGALERYVKAYMSGNARVEASEFERARSELESTGQPGLVARAELTRCAVRVASLVFEPCEGFERLRADSPAAERAYADYLAGRIAPPDVALLPPQHRAAAAEPAARRRQGDRRSAVAPGRGRRAVSHRPGHAGSAGAGGGHRLGAGLAPAAAGLAGRCRPSAPNRPARWRRRSACAGAWRWRRASARV